MECWDNGTLGLEGTLAASEAFLPFGQYFIIPAPERTAVWAR